MGGGVSTTLNAQRSDGFFRGGSDDSYSNRDDGMSLGDAVNENPTPLGSGLLIMMAAGAGYAVARRKRKSNSKIKKTSTTLFLALTLILGMTQCKKSTVAPTTDNGIHITLNAGQGAKGDKTDFTPTSFVWTNEATEYIYVGGSQHGECLGVLSGTGNGKATMSFSGDLTTTPNNGETLHFFYLGKGRDGSAVTTLDFSNQDGTLENVTKYHIAIGDATYSTGQTSFSASLEMKMAIAYFNTSDFAGEEVFLHGNDIISKAPISYKDGKISTNTIVTRGFINTGSGKSNAYVALIPSTESETTLKFDSNNKQGGEITFGRGIQAGRYYSNSGAALAVSEPTSVTNDVIKGLFTVSANKGVRFAKGNLQYTRESTDVEWSTGAYSFMNYQYETIETGNVSSNYGSEKAIGLFGWGTGDNPTTTSTEASDYSDFTDWGDNVSVGGYNWYTLSQSEWNYLLNTRSASTLNGIQNARFVKATVNGVKGVILFPDAYTHPENVSLPTAARINATNYSGSDSYTTAQFGEMETNGAVFLPRTGYRNGTTVSDYATYNPAGRYHTSTYSSATNCYYFSFANYNLTIGNIDRFNGHAVRLVRDVE